MASPIGHVLAGQLAYRGGSAATGTRNRRLAWLCAFAAIAPDLDFLPGLLLGHPALYHQGASHSFAAAIVVSFLLAVIATGRWDGLPAAWGTLFAAYSSHLVLDLFGPDKRPPYGIPLFWPFTGATFLSPVQLFPGFHHAGSTAATVGQWIRGVLDPRNLRAFAFEIVWLGPVVVGVELWVRRRARGRRVTARD